MTNEQITIDYKNICENYSKEVGCYNTFDGNCIKEQCFTYRLLQLLQAKEQECEKLKKARRLIETSRDKWEYIAKNKERECQDLQGISIKNTLNVAKFI